MTATVKKNDTTVFTEIQILKQASSDSEYNTYKCTRIHASTLEKLGINKYLGTIYEN